MSPPPVDPDHEYVDKSHPLTKKDNTYRYGCWTIHSYKDRKSVIDVQVGWDFLGRKKISFWETEWLDINCPHEARAQDPFCLDCGLQLLPTKKG